MRRIHAVGLLLGASIGLVACGQLVDQNTRAPDSAATNTTPTSEDGADIGADIEADIEARLPPLLDQRRFTREEPPTFSEYEEAVFASTECLEALGFEVLGPYLSSDPEAVVTAHVPGVDRSKTYAWGIVNESEKRAALPLGTASDLCRDRYLTEIELIYFSPSESDLRVWLDNFRECMIEDGITEAADVPNERLIDLPYPAHCWP